MSASPGELARNANSQALPHPSEQKRPTWDSALCLSVAGSRLRSRLRTLTHGGSCLPALAELGTGVREAWSGQTAGLEQPRLLHSLSHNQRGRRVSILFQKIPAAGWHLLRIQGGPCPAASSQGCPPSSTRPCRLLPPSTALCHSPAWAPIPLILGHPLTQRICLPILVWYSEHAHDLMALLPQVAVYFLAKQALPDHRNLHGSR